MMEDLQSMNTVSSGTRNPAKPIPRPPPAEKIPIPRPLCLGGNQFPITLSPGTNTPEKATPSRALESKASGRLLDNANKILKIPTPMTPKETIFRGPYLSTRYQIGTCRVTYVKNWTVLRSPASVKVRFRASIINGRTGVYATTVMLEPKRANVVAPRT